MCTGILDIGLYGSFYNCREGGFSENAVVRRSYKEQFQQISKVSIGAISPQQREMKSRMKIDVPYGCLQCGLF